MLSTCPRIGFIPTRDPAVARAFARYPFLPPDQIDEHGIWTTPTGSKVAWFQDPDGNTLSLSQHAP